MLPTGSPAGWISRSRGWRVGYQQFRQPLPLPRKTRQSLADSLGTLVGKKALIGLGLVRSNIIKSGVIVGQDDLLACRHGTQALVPRGCCQP